MTEQLKQAERALDRMSGYMPRIYKDDIEIVRRALTTSQSAHPDDLAVDRFAAAMKAKLEASRAKGRGGWDDPEQCAVEQLARLLVDHIPKGDPVDVANFAMMLHQRGADRSVLALTTSQPAQAGEVDERVAFERWAPPAFSRRANIDGEGDLVYDDDWMQGAWVAYNDLTQPAAQATPEPASGNLIGAAMGGYLRRSRSGGMSRKQSDLVQFLVDDAERLGYFKIAIASAIAQASAATPTQPAAQATPEPEVLARTDFTLDVSPETVARLKADKAAFEAECGGATPEPVHCDMGDLCPGCPGDCPGKDACRDVNETNKILADNYLRDTATPPQQAAGEPVAWEATTAFYTKYITDSRYQKLKPEFRRWYKPYHCSSCATHPAPGVPEGFALVKSPITEAMHEAACKVLTRSTGMDGLPQRMLDALAAAAQAKGGKHGSM